MKHPVHRHAPSHRSEWLSAIFTLLVLTGIYSSMDNFSSYSALLPEKHEEKTIDVVLPYWNDVQKYGFSSAPSEEPSHPPFQVSADGKTVYTADGVRVQYYKDSTISEIEKTLDTSTPRAYSRLSGGIAVITGNLDSPAAKTILATLRSE